MDTVLIAEAPVGTSGYTLLIADSQAQINAAQRLRHRVFAEELGATLHTTVPGVDVDEFDAHCDHLIVRHDPTGEVVGTYRMLPPERAASTGRRYSDDEFDMTALRPLREHLVEVGRSCVHPDHRSGAVINLMWAGLTRYLHLSGHGWLGGCVSVPVADGGVTAAGVWRQVRDRHLAPPTLRIRPHRPWFAEPGAAGPDAPGPDAPGPDAPGPDAPGPNAPGCSAAPGGVADNSVIAASPANTSRVALPPLLRGYLRLGSWVCGEPAYDPDFQVADLFVLLSLDRMDPRYRRRFLGATR